MEKYDYLVVGSGLFGAICSYEAKKKGKKVLVIDKRNHLGGNIYTEKKNGINVHVYGAHIFHTSNKKVWDYINQFTEFNRYTNSPIARYKNELYNLPFNMNTFNKLWNDVITPEDALRHINEEREELLKELNGREPKNLEEQAISLIGKTIYEKLIKGYTEKQWGMSCTEIPAFIIKRLPVRLVYDNNYFNDKYQGIPIGGYTKIIEKMLGIDEYGNKTIESDDTKGIIDLKLGYDYFENTLTNSEKRETNEKLEEIRRRTITSNISGGSLQENNITIPEKNIYNARYVKVTKELMNLLDIKYTGDMQTYISLKDLNIIGSVNGSTSYNNKPLYIPRNFRYNKLNKCTLKKAF